MPMRNPFRRQAPPTGLGPLTGFNNRTAGSSLDSSDGASTMGSTTPSTISLASRRDEPGEYKLSVVSDNGVYLPPSPTQEKPAGWLTSPRLNSSSGRSHKSRPSLTDEPFSNISRESFDSYRRSFDISARSPVYGAKSDSPPRTSLDSRLARPNRATLRDSSFGLEHPREEEEEDPAAGGQTLQKDADQFEDVGLNDESQALATAAKPPRKGIFSRFGGSSAQNPPRPSSSGKETGGLGIFHGRKRGQSGQGAELGSIPAPQTDNKQPAATVTAAVGAVEG